MSEHNAENDVAPDLTDPGALVSIHNRAGGGWSGFVAIARAVDQYRPLPPGTTEGA